jgi:hypothetical protein
MSQDLSQWFEDDLLPALFENLPSAFPEFGWVKDGSMGWKATKSPLGAKAARIVCHKPFGFLIHGGESVSWLSYVNDGTRPTGSDFIKALKDLAQRAGKSLPAKDLTPEEKERREAKEKERDLVEAVVQFCHKLLLESPEAQEARTYLEGRGLPRDRWEVWELGFMPKEVSPILQEVERLGRKWEDAKAILLGSGLLRDTDKDGKPLTALRPLLGGRIVAPWRGPGGTVSTWWGRKLPSSHPEAPKYLYAAGSGRKDSPYLLNRSPKGGRLLVVEGVLDAITCREHDFPAVALGGASLGSLLPALKTHRPDGLTLTMDPDAAGEEATRRAVAQILEAGLSVFVVELPKSEKGEKLDPDALLRTPKGPETLRRLVEESPHGLRWEARSILTTHRGEGWTDRGTAGALQEAVAFAGKLPAVFHPLLPSTFFEELGQEIPLSPETMAEAAKALHEKTESERHELETRLHLVDIQRTVGKLLEDGKPLEARSTLLQETAILQANGLKVSRPVPKVVLDELEELEERLNSRRGRDRVGLFQDSLKELDEALMGLRGLMLVAGPPGTGKTSLAVQLGLSAMETDPEAAVVLLSLEQSRWEHLLRNLAFFSGLPWKVVAMGSSKNRTPEHREAKNFFQPFDLQKLRKGEKDLKALAHRFLILDDTNFLEPTVEALLLEVEKLKEKTGAKKVLLIVDYLQIWPVPVEVMKAIRTDLDRDKWQIGQLKTLKNLLGPEDAIIAISEAAKADWKAGMSLSSVMGSARGSYTPDVVMVLQPYYPEALVPKEDEDGKPLTEKELKKAKGEGQKILDALLDEGRSLIRLEILKGRDGVHRRGFDLAFLFETLRFEETTLEAELKRVRV